MTESCKNLFLLAESNVPDGAPALVIVRIRLSVGAKSVKRLRDVFHLMVLGAAPILFAGMLEEMSNLIDWVSTETADWGELDGSRLRVCVR